LRIDNGHSLRAPDAAAVAFNNVRRHRKGLAYFPALSLSHGEHCTLNFGNTPFQYPIEGFKPLQDPPPPSLGAQVC
jgi:Kip1 ubiquitination-promoting complex protein 1